MRAPLDMPADRVPGPVGVALLDLLDGVAELLAEDVHAGAASAEALDGRHYRAAEWRQARAYAGEGFPACGLSPLFCLLVFVLVRHVALDEGKG